MKKEILFILLVALVFNLSAQVTFEKTYGGNITDGGISGRQTIDGGYILVGLTNSFGAGNSDVYLIKTNADGDTLWTRTFGGTSYDAGYSVQQTTDSGYILTGYTSSFGAGWEDMYLIKTNSNGDTLWTKTFGGNYTDYGEFVQQTTDGGYCYSRVYIKFWSGKL